MIKDVCRKSGISDVTHYNWKTKHDGKAVVPSVRRELVDYNAQHDVSLRERMPHRGINDVVYRCKTDTMHDPAILAIKGASERYPVYSFSK